MWVKDDCETAGMGDKKRLFAIEQPCYLLKQSTSRLAGRTLHGKGLDLIDHRHQAVGPLG
jgi:hypothetical protein